MGNNTISKFTVEECLHNSRTKYLLRVEPNEMGPRGRGGRRERIWSFRRKRELMTETKWSELLPTRSSYKERKGNALASGADEGRDKLR